MLMKYSSFILIVFLLFSCKTGIKKESRVNINDSIIVIDVNPKQSNEIDFNDIYSDYSFIKLETNDSVLLSGVEKIEIFNDRIYVFDSRGLTALHCFDMHGRYLFGVGHKGQGPGEYGFTSDFSIDKENKKIWMGDDSRKILSYDLDGHFLKEYKVDFSIRNIAPIPNSKELFLIRFGYYKDKDYSSGIYSLKRNDVTEYLSIVTAFEPQIGGQSTSSFQDELLFGFGFNDTVYRVNAQSGYIPKYILDFGKNKFPEIELKKEMRTFFSEFLKIPSPYEYAGLVTIVIETDDYLLFTYNYHGKHVKAIYSKDKNKVFNISKVLSDDKEQKVITILSYTDSNNVYSILDSESIVDEDINNYSDNTLPKFGVFNSLEEVKAVTKVDDNPIIVKGVINIHKFFAD